MDTISASRLPTKGGKWFGGYACNSRGDNYCLSAKNSCINKLSYLSDVEFYKGKIRQLTALLDEKDQKIEQLQNQNNSLKERLLNLSCILKEASEICNPVNL